MGKRWVPLESNPDVLNTFAKAIGAPCSLWSFCDVYGMDEELLGMVPKPVKAVLMLFPITDATEAAKASEEERLKAAGQKLSPDLWFSKQTISNACGTVAMLHAYANNPDVEPAAGSFLEKYLTATKDMSPEERARFLEYPKEGEPDIEAAHSEAAQDGQSAPPPDEEQVLLHFVCFVNKDGHLYELDGRKFDAVDHGSSQPDDLLKDTCGVVKKYVETTGSIRFNLIALAPAQD